MKKRLELKLQLVTQQDTTMVAGGIPVIDGRSSNELVMIAIQTANWLRCECAGVQVYGHDCYDTREKIMATLRALAVPFESFHSTENRVIGRKDSILMFTRTVAAQE